MLATVRGRNERILHAVETAIAENGWDQPPRLVLLEKPGKNTIEVIEIPMFPRIAAHGIDPLDAIKYITRLAADTVNDPDRPPAPHPDTLYGLALAAEAIDVHAEPGAPPPEGDWRDIPGAEEIRAVVLATLDGDTLELRRDRFTGRTNLTEHRGGDLPAALHGLLNKLRDIAHHDAERP